MIHPRVITICIVLSSFLFIGCAFENLNQEIAQSDDTESVKEYPLVESSLWTYFENFEREALLRNIRLDLNALEVTGAISDIPEDGVAGTCRYGQHIHQVTVDRDYWNSVGHLRREMVVFHELGHCVLGIGHREADNGQGACLSLMNSGTTNCRVAYTEENRNYYLDELFDEED